MWRAVAAVAAVLDPALVILGGGIGAGAGQLLVEPMQRVLERISPLRPRFAVSELGSAAVLDGAVTEGLGIVMDLQHADGNPTRLVFSIENGLLGEHPIRHRDLEFDFVESHCHGKAPFNPILHPREVTCTPPVHAGPFDRLL